MRRHFRTVGCLLALVPMVDVDGCIGGHLKWQPPDAAVVPKRAVRDPPPPPDEEPTPVPPPTESPKELEIYELSKEVE